MKFVGFEVLTAVVMKSFIFWDIAPCNPLKVNGRFGGTYMLPSSCWFLFFFQWPSFWRHLAHEESCIPVQLIYFVLVQAIMCCSFSVVQWARVEISTDASNFTPFMLVYCLAYSTLNREATWISETYLMICWLVGYLMEVFKLLRYME
jgi:hypothetical protein